MKTGSLVVTTNRWTPRGMHVGIAVSQTVKRDDTWIILWSSQGIYRLEEHIVTSLTVVSETSDLQETNSED